MSENKYLSKGTWFQPGGNLKEKCIVTCNSLILKRKFTYCHHPLSHDYLFYSVDLWWVGVAHFLEVKEEMKMNSVSFDSFLHKIGYPDSGKI